MKKSISKKNISIALLMLSSQIYYISYSMIFTTEWRDSDTYIYLVDNISLDNSFYRIFKTEEVNDYLPLPISIYKGWNSFFWTDTFISCKALSIVLGTITITVIWNIVHLITKRIIISDFLSLFALFHTTLSDFFTQVSRDSLYIFFLSTSLLVLISEIKQHSIIKVLLLPLLTTLILSVRFEGLELVLIFPIILIIYSSRRTLYKALIQFSSYILLSCLYLVLIDNIIFGGKISSFAQIFKGIINRFSLI